MPTISLYQYFSVDADPEHPIKGGSLSKAKSIVLSTGEILDQKHNVAPTTAVKLFDKTELETLGAFDFLWLETDFDVLVQFTTDAGTSDGYFVKELKGTGAAGNMGPALVLGSDLAHIIDGTVDAFDGTEDTIDEIWVYNESATDTARVRIVVGT